MTKKQKQRARKASLATTANKPAAQLELPEFSAAPKKNQEKPGNLPSNSPTHQAASAKPQPSRNRKRRLQKKMAAQSHTLRGLQAVPENENQEDGLLLFPQNYTNAVALASEHCGWQMGAFGPHPNRQGSIGARVRDEFHPLVGRSVAEIKQKFSDMLKNREEDLKARYGKADKNSLAQKLTHWPHFLPTPLRAPYEPNPEFNSAAAGGHVGFALACQPQDQSTLVSFLTNNEDICVNMLEHIAISGHFPMANFMQTCQKLFSIVTNFSTTADITTKNFLVDNYSLTKDESVASDTGSPSQNLRGSSLFGNDTATRESETNTLELSKVEPANMAARVHVTASRLTTSFIRSLPNEHPISQLVREDVRQINEIDDIVFATMISRMKEEKLEAKFGKYWQEKMAICIHGYLSHELSDLHQLLVGRWFDRSFTLYQELGTRAAMTRMISIHANPFFDWRTCGSLLKSLPVLQFLGIYKCPLIHVGAVPHILQAVGHVGKTRPVPKIQVDVYPMYHQGPSVGAQGNWLQMPCEFGLSWEQIDKESLNVRSGLAILVLRIVGLAQALDIDIATPGCAFREWLDRIPVPLGFIPYLLDICGRLYDWGRVANRNQEIKMTLLGEWFAIARGPVGKTGIKWHQQSPVWRHKGHRCHICGYQYPAFQMNNTIYSNPEDQASCDGCKLMRLLDQEDDHSKYDQRRILTALYPSTTDAANVLRLDPEDNVGIYTPLDVVRLPVNPVAMWRPHKVHAKAQKAEVVIDCLASIPDFATIGNITRLQEICDDCGTAINCWEPQHTTCTYCETPIVGDKLARLAEAYQRTANYADATLKAMLHDKELRFEFIRTAKDQFGPRRMGYKDPLHGQQAVVDSNGGLAPMQWNWEGFSKLEKQDAKHAKHWADHRATCTPRVRNYWCPDWQPGDDGVQAPVHDSFW